MKRITIGEEHKTVSITAYLNDFIGDSEKWREAYFRMLSWKNTFDVVYQMDILESRKNGVYVWLVLHTADKADRTIEMMNDLGYQNIKTAWVTVGEYELDIDETGCDYLFEM